VVQGAESLAGWRLNFSVPRYITSQFSFHEIVW
jgi:hypothetical protein